MRGEDDGEDARGWLAVRGARRVWRGFAAGWRGQPFAAIRRWWIELTLLLAAATAAVLAMVAAAHRAAGAGRLAWEAEVVAGSERWPLSFGHALVADAAGSPLLLVPLVLAAAGLAALRERPLRALTFLATYLMVSLVVIAGWMVWARARPTLILDGMASPGFHAFPSGHVAQAAAVYGTLAAVWFQATRHRGERTPAVLLALTATGLVAAARLRLGVHWPTDLAAGFVVGGGWAVGGTWILRRAERSGGR